MRFQRVNAILATQRRHQPENNISYNMSRRRHQPEVLLFLVSRKLDAHSTKYHLNALFTPKVRCISHLKRIIGPARKCCDQRDKRTCITSTRSKQEQLYAISLCLCLLQVHLSKQTEGEMVKHTDWTEIKELDENQQWQTGCLLKKPRFTRVSQVYKGVIARSIRKCGPRGNQ